jgi:hypothetical protein
MEGQFAVAHAGSTRTKGKEVMPKPTASVGISARFSIRRVELKFYFLLQILC